MTKDLNVFDKHYGLLINGEWTNGSEGNTLTSHNPANGEALATFIDATDADVDAAVNAAYWRCWSNYSMELSVLNGCMENSAGIGSRLYRRDSPIFLYFIELTFLSSKN